MSDPTLNRRLNWFLVIGVGLLAWTVLTMGNLAESGTRKLARDMEKFNTNTEQE